MSRFVNGVAIGGVAFFVLLAGFWYAAEVRPGPQVSPTGFQAWWGAADSTSTRVTALVTFHSAHKSPVPLVEVRYEVSLNDRILDQGTTPKNLHIPAESSEVVDFTSRFPSSFVTEWWRSHAERGEASQFAIRGEGIFLIHQARVPIPFSWQSEWSSSFLSALSTDLPNCPSPSGRVCIERAAHTWELGAGSDVYVRESLGLWNPNLTRARIASWTTDVRLQNVTIASGAFPGPVELDAGARVEFVLDLRTDLFALTQWWPAHVAPCERSATAVQVRYALETWAAPDNGTANGSGNQTPAPVGWVPESDVGWERPTSPFETSFVCRPTTPPG